MVGNQHGISFSLEVGLEDDESDNDDDEGVELGVQFEGSQVPTDKSKDVVKAHHTLAHALQ